MIVIGASLGGLRALGTVLSGLPLTFRPPIAVVLHRAKDTPDLLASIIQARTTLKIIEVSDKDPIEEGCVYLAPADYHLMVDRGHFSLSIDSPVNYARPSIDVLFESAADIFGNSLTAVVLTGSSADGAAGAEAIAARGGEVIVQEPASAEGSVMPSSTLNRVPKARILVLSEIASKLAELTLTSQ
jgi:two-component system chemotaxis response regulator CheB